MTTTASRTTRFSVGPKVRQDWESRGLARTITYENEEVSAGRITGSVVANPFPGFLTAGTIDATVEDLRSILRDADYYADPDGPAYSDPDLRAAYRRVKAKAADALRKLEAAGAADLYDPHSDARPDGAGTYTAWITDDPEGTELAVLYTEEIDVWAMTPADARTHAEAVMREMYDDEYRILRVEQRFGLYF